MFFMIISFLFFVTFVFFLFVILKPYDTQTLTGAVVTGMFNSFEENTRTNLTNIFLKAATTQICQISFLSNMECWIFRYVAQEISRFVQEISRFVQEIARFSVYAKTYENQRKIDEKSTKNRNARYTPIFFNGEKPESSIHSRPFRS